MHTFYIYYSTALQPYDIRAAHKPITTLRYVLTNVKDKDQPHDRFFVSTDSTTTGRSVLIATMGDLFNFASTGELASTTELFCISTLFDVLISEKLAIYSNKKPLSQIFIYFEMHLGTNDLPQVESDRFFQNSIAELVTSVSRIAGQTNS